MRLRPLLVVAALALLGAACSSDGEESSPEVTDAPTEAPTDAPGDDASEAPTDAPTDDATEAPTEAPPAEPTDEPEGDGVGGATLTIGDETWTFDEVTLCTASEQEDATVSFVMLIIDDPWQFVGKVVDPTGDRRLEGDGVYDQIDFQNIEDGTQGIWMAGGEAAGEQFFVIDGNSVTASAAFDDFRTTEIETTPGTLDATCS